jgi:hypothetical protein
LYKLIWLEQLLLPARGELWSGDHGDPQEAVASPPFTAGCHSKFRGRRNKCTGNEARQETQDTYRSSGALLHTDTREVNEASKDAEFWRDTAHREARVRHSESLRPTAESKLLSLVRHETQKHLEAETVIDNGRFIWMSNFHFIETLMEFIRSRFRRVGTATERSRVRIPERKDFFLGLADRL